MVDILKNKYSYKRSLWLYNILSKVFQYRYFAPFIERCCGTLIRAENPILKLSDIVIRVYNTVFPTILCPK